MAKSKTQNFLKIICATSVTLFSLLAVFTGCFSWFNAKRTYNAENDTFTVSRIESSFSALHIHKATSADDDNYVFSSTPEDTITFDSEGKAEHTNDEPISFGQFDPRSPHHPLLFDFELSSSVTVASGAEINLMAKTERSFVGINGEDLSATSNPLSWIISAYAFHTNEASISYSYAVDDLGVSKHFVSFTGDHGNLSYSGFENSLRLLSPAVGTTLRHVVLIMDYYADAVSYIYNRYLGSEILDQDNVPFFVDWELSL